MIDYTIEYNDGAFAKALVVHGEGKNILILYKLPEPYQRLDGKRVSYELEYRWLSCECLEESDEAWACVQGSERTYWSIRELFETGVLTKGGKIKCNVNLFHCFTLS